MCGKLIHGRNLLARLQFSGTDGILEFFYELFVDRSLVGCLK